MFLLLTVYFSAIPAICFCGPTLALVPNQDLSASTSQIPNRYKGVSWTGQVRQKFVPSIRNVPTDGEIISVQIQLVRTLLQFSAMKKIFLSDYLDNVELLRKTILRYYLRKKVVEKHHENFQRCFLFPGQNALILVVIANNF